MVLEDETYQLRKEEERSGELSGPMAVGGLQSREESNSSP